MAVFGDIFIIIQACLDITRPSQKTYLRFLPLHRPQQKICSRFLGRNMPKGTRYKKPDRDVLPKMHYKMQNLVYEWVNFSKFAQIWAKIGSNLRTFEKMGDLAQNKTDWFMNGSLFLEKLVLVWVYFQIPWWHIPIKTKLKYPPTISPFLLSMTQFQ